MAPPTIEGIPSITFNMAMQHIPVKDTTKELVTVFAGIVGAIFTFLYTYGTVRKTTIEVQAKYQHVKNGFTYLMVVDHAQNHYIVGYSLLFWRFNQFEDWVAIQDDGCYNYDITYYGWRIPMFGIFPVIIKQKLST